MNAAHIPKIRFQSLDALRGLAILMMILSGTIPFGGSLPGWMYHAQVPPPGHFFQPELPGITWVDLVFPFFLFSMGAAIPFSLGGKIDRGIPSREIGWGLLVRFAGLAIFAIVSQHARPWGMAVDSWLRWLFALIAMVGMLLVFAVPSEGWWRKNRKIVVATGCLLLVLLFGSLHWQGILSFRLTRFDVIIMILANTALGGGLLYAVYRRFYNALWVGFALMVAFFLSARDGGNWVADIYNWSPLSWLISWNYLKYMVIVIPGIYTGIVIRDAIKTISETNVDNRRSFADYLVVMASVALVLVAVIGLYWREMVWSFVLTLLLVVLLFFAVWKWENQWRPVFMKLLPMAIVLIVGGYLLEPMHGGIKKDSATLSYLLLTAGLALVTLFAFVVIIEVIKINKGLFLLTGSGKNAMLAYVVGSNLVIPILVLSGVDKVFEIDCCPVLLQTVRAVFITLLVSWISTKAAQKGLFMKV